ncbi:MAG TPA: hypothetical protein VFP53_06680 [Sphingomicrobium sp.]|nr:hypothetical protein [Sphingomicrobium sp.]
MAGALIAGAALRDRSPALPARPPSERSELLLLSSLPIVFPEDFSLNSERSPVLAVLEKQYRIVPISVADSKSLSGHDLLLMAQPRAQPAEALVELDRWVRGGGRVAVLADPVLEWPSQRPLGDVLRPAMAFADTGLLGHWGLRLDAPELLGPASFEVEGKLVHTLSPGSLVATGRNCKVEAGRLIARCDVGRGEATVIADADFLDVARRREPTRTSNVRFLADQLQRLRR